MKKYTLWKYTLASCGEGYPQDFRRCLHWHTHTNTPTPTNTPREIQNVATPMYTLREHVVPQQSHVLQRAQADSHTHTDIHGKRAEAPHSDDGI